MPQHRRHDLHISPGRERDRRRDVPEVVKPDRRKAGLVGQLLEELAHPRGVQLGAVLSCEDPAGLLPRLAPLQPLGVLPCPVGLQYGRRASVEGDRAVGGVGLRGALLELPAELDELLGDRERALVEVDVDPADAARLAAAKPPEGDQVEQGVQPVLGRVVEERAELAGRPHHDRGRPQLGGRVPPHLEAAHGLAPGRRASLLQPPVVRLHERLGPGLRPDERLGPLARVELDQLGGVGPDHALALGIAQHGPERRPDALLGRRSRDLLPLDRRPRLAVAGGSHLPDGLVLLLDPDEHGLQRDDPEAVHADLGEDLFQVDAVVGFVTHQGRLADVAGLAPALYPGGEVLAEPDRLERLAGLVLPAELVLVGPRRLLGVGRHDQVPDFHAGLVSLVPGVGDVEQFARQLVGVVEVALGGEAAHPEEDPLSVGPSGQLGFTCPRPMVRVP
nr:hypothetical protein [Herbidospora daliensis]